MNRKQKIEELFEKYEEENMIVTTKMRRPVHKRNELLKKVRSSLSSEDNNNLDSVFELDNEVGYNEIKNSFINGFSLATQLFSQSMKNKVI